MLEFGRVSRLSMTRSLGLDQFGIIITVFIFGQFLNHFFAFVLFVFCFVVIFVFVSLVLVISEISSNQPRNHSPSRVDHKLKHDVCDKRQSYKVARLGPEPDAEVLVQLLAAVAHLRDEADVGHEEEAEAEQDDDESEPGVVVEAEEQVEVDAGDDREVERVRHVEGEVGGLHFAGGGHLEVGERGGHAEAEEDLLPDGALVEVGLAVAGAHHGRVLLHRVEFAHAVLHRLEDDRPTRLEHVERLLLEGVLEDAVREEGPDAEEELRRGHHHVFVEEVLDGVGVLALLLGPVAEDQPPDELELRNGVVGRSGSLDALFALDADAYVGHGNHVDVVGAVADGEHD